VRRLRSQRAREVQAKRVKEIKDRRGWRAIAYAGRRKGSALG